MDLYISIRSFARINWIEKFKSDNMKLITFFGQIYSLLVWTEDIALSERPL